ncbi:MAG: sigma-70 family RNA polymerase sigma factor [Planctomycetes bacterium]|nr:sigma-70 family RNA polymerase sigma factor [Planctomycetota bacterium]
MREHADETAWRWFIERYRGYLRAVLKRMLPSADCVETAVDEFWGYLFQSGLVARMQRPMRFRAFLVGTLRNYAYDWLRRNPRAQHAPTTIDTPAPIGWLPEDEEVALWVHQLLHLALQRLVRMQPRHAQVLRGCYGLGDAADSPPAVPVSPSQMALEMGLTRNALHQLTHRARETFRQCIVEEVRQTVSTEGDMADELAVLVEAVGRRHPGLVPPAPDTGVRP